MKPEFKKLIYCLLALLVVAAGVLIYTLPTSTRIQMADGGECSCCENDDDDEDPDGDSMTLKI
jgi:hypothetical protein